MMLDLAGPLLSLSSLDCESLDVTFGFDFNYRGNHDEVVSEAFAKDTKIGNVLGYLVPKWLITSRPLPWRLMINADCNAESA